MEMTLTVKLTKIIHAKNIRKPTLNKKAFYKIYSSSTFTLKPTESITIDLKININWPEGLTPTKFDLIPVLTGFGLCLIKSNWKTSQTENKSIAVTILNNGVNLVNIKKNNWLLYFLLPYTNKKIITEYEYNKSFN